MKRSPMPRSIAPIGRRKPLKPMSDKRRKLLPLRKLLRAEVLERDGKCMAADLVPDVRCWGRAEGHEIIKHNKWQAGWLRGDNVIAVCSIHNQWVEDWPNRAFELGLMKHAPPGPVRKFDWEPE